MDFRQLETFTYIAKYKSFSKAAKELYLTQPTISNHIQNLEKELGTILINRTNKNINLTKAGEILYSFAVDMLNNRKKALFSLGEYMGKIEGTIELSASSIPEAYIIPDLVMNFRKSYPHVNFKISHHDSMEVIEEILNQKIDFGFVGAKIPNSNFEYIPLVEDELVLISGKNAQLDLASEISLEDISNLPLIMREEGSGTRKLLLSELKKKKIDYENLDIVAHLENTDTIKQMVRRNLGVSIVSNKAVTDELAFDLLNVHRIKDCNLKRKFYFIFSKKRILAPLEENFKDFVIELFKDKSSKI